MDWQQDFPYDHTVVDLLLPGVPGEADIQQLLRDTEEKLKLNACSIEQSLKDLQGRMGEHWGGERPSSPTEILQWFNPRNPSGLKPVATGHQELLEFYRALQQYLKAEENREEVVLQLLVNISYQCGVCFPSSSPLASRQSSPLPSLLCTVREESAPELQDLWEDVRLQLQRHLLKKLEPAGAREGEEGKEVKDEDEEEEEEECEASRVPRRILCLQQLLFLYPESQVLARYQRLRTKAVQALIQTAQAGSPGAGERGFQRLAAGFQAAAPALVAMVSEDLHALNAVGAEPHATLAFLNRAYLGAVSAELAALMEREVQGALKDNTPPKGKAGRRQSRSKATVVPQEPVRNFSLTSHQLGCLTGLASTLLELEQKVEELASEVGFLNCAGESSCSPRGILKKSKEDTEATPGEGSSAATPDLILNSAEAVSLEFEWRGAFVELVPQMAHCVKVLLEDVCARSLQQEEVARANSAVLALGSVPQRQGIALTCLERECPKMIAKPWVFILGMMGARLLLSLFSIRDQFCGDVMKEVDNLLPLAIVSRGDPLLPVRRSFVDVSARVALALVGRLQERAKEVPADAPFQNLCGLLATSIYIRQRLEHYESELTDSARTPLGTQTHTLPIQKCWDLSSSLQDQLACYCLSVCASSLLHDAESHHWADPKPFYEDERCSFSVHMWHYFLSGVRSDLWGALPPELARRLLAQVLCESLQLLVQRYSRARPSYRRVQQVRSDITAILLCVQQLLWSVCEGLGELLASEAKSSSSLPGSSSAADWVVAAHGLCMQLLNVLVVVTAPLTELHGTFQSGPESLGVQSAQAEDEDAPPAQAEGGAPTDSEGAPSSKVEGDAPAEGEGVPSPKAEDENPGLDHAYWLAVINPAVFPEQSLRDGVSSEESCLWLLRLLGAGPCFSPSLLLNTLLHRDCLLLRTLMATSYLFAEEPAEVPPESQEAVDRFLEAVVCVLASLSKVPRVLTLVLEPYLNKTQLWDHLYNPTDSGRLEPAMLRCIRAMVSRPTDSLLRQLVTMVQSSSEDLPGSLLQHDAPECLLSKVPKVWNYIPHDARGKDTSKNTGKSVAMQALSFIFTNLPSAVASLSLPVRFLFVFAEKRLSQHARQQLRPTGLLLWALLTRLCQGLEDGEALERLAARPLERGAKERLALLSECLQASVGQQRGVPKPAVHMVLQGLEERRPKWISIQLHKARKLCCKSVFERAESEWLQDKGGGVAAAAAAAAASASASASASVTAAEASELKTHLMVLELSHRAGGSQHLGHIYHIITLNEELLWRRLSPPHVLSEDPPQDSTLSLTFDLPDGWTPSPASHFNPLTRFDHFGYDEFDQAGLSQREWAWDALLLSAYRRMSQVTFRVLLRNRWEMQEGAELEDEEKVLVDHLQDIWFPPSPGPSS